MRKPKATTTPEPKAKATPMHPRQVMIAERHRQAFEAAAAELQRSGRLPRCSAADIIREGAWRFAQECLSGRDPGPFQSYATGPEATP